MIAESESDRLLRVRYRVVFVLFFAVVLVNAGMAVESMLNRHVHDELLTEWRAEVKSRIAEVESVQADVGQLQERTKKLNDQAAKIAAEIAHPKTDPGAAPSENQPAAVAP